MALVDAVLDYFGLIKKRVPDPEQLRHQKALRVLRLVAAGVAGAYGVALLYRVGAVAKLLPAPLNAGLERRVEQIKKLTEPRLNPRQFAAARAHLMRVYGTTSGLCCVSAAGSVLFFNAPYVPIAVPITLTAVPAAVVVLVPRDFTSEAGRALLGLLAAFSCGYSFGPLNWVAYDSVLPFACVVASTFVGFGVPLFLTRGMVAYFLSTQLLSASLAVIAGTAFSEREDVNVMLTAQLLANSALGALHTLPTILRCVRTDAWTPSARHRDERMDDARPAPFGDADADEDEDADEDADEDTDVLLEAFGIYGALAYFVWSAFRLSSQVMLRRMTKDDPTGLTREEQRKLERFATLSRRTERVSGIMASVLFLLFYVRVVGYVQRTGRTSAKLDHLRHLFARMSPLSLAQV